MVTEAITRQIGPLPAWQWALVLAGGYIGYRFLKGGGVGSGSSDTAATTSNLADTGSNIVQGPQGETGATGPSGTTFGVSAQDITDWANAGLSAADIEKLIKDLAPPPPTTTPVTNPSAPALPSGVTKLGDRYQWCPPSGSLLKIPCFTLPIGWKPGDPIIISNPIAPPTTTPGHQTPGNVPPTTVHPTVHPSVKPVYYTIKRGDTLTKIAARYHTTVARLLKLNPYIKNKNLIYTGKKVRVK